VNVADDDWELDYGCDEEWPKRKQDILYEASVYVCRLFHQTQVE